ncbi:DUF2530 domain-containing protein [Mycobacterium shinjukuense]|uniref:DUF2530 domain-containing protein n=1 Tax=Mycobacterium shinjukuense TaxID=398694 RepID=A0A7I7MIY0_9MYCO|nr:DUF2530 domain-containing protein [Mycobacterium shinjukuense]MCV6984476.1 DUF2530 domain-containing protein [Mycobacterium shinjukuense]BBX72138.1 hypothetical protein MSHI_00440 [Mycobacterium shinjukuense]
MGVNTDQNPEPPPLPPALLEVWPFILVGALAWLAAAAAAFFVPGLQSWRPLTVAGLGVGMLGTSLFCWQLAAARRGARGAQAGLETLSRAKPPSNHADPPGRTNGSPAPANTD